MGLKVLKNKLSEFVRLAAGGETILVTDRDRVVAEIGPPHGERRTMSDDEWFADQVRKGIITPPTRPPGVPPKGEPVMTFEELMKEIEQDREDR